MAHNKKKARPKRQTSEKITTLDLKNKNKNIEIFLQNEVFYLRKGDMDFLLGHIDNNM